MLPTARPQAADPLTTSPPGRRPAVRFVASVLTLVAALALATSCSTIRTLIDLDSDLKRAGYAGLDTNTDETNGFTTITVRASSGPSPETAARIVWTQFPRRVDRVVVEVASQRRSFGRQEMRQRFGARPSGYDDKSVGDDLKTAGITILLIVVGVLVVGGGLILFIVLKVSSNKRKRRIAAGGYPNPPQWGQRPQAGQWGQPQPGPWGQQPNSPPGGQWGAPQPPPPSQWGAPQGQPPPSQWGAPPAPPAPTNPDPRAPRDADSYPPPPPD